MAKQKTTDTDAQAVSPETTVDEVNETQTEEHIASTTKVVAMKYIGEHRTNPIPLRKGSIFYGLPKVLEKELEKDATLKALFIQVDSE